MAGHPLGGGAVRPASGSSNEVPLDGTVLNE